MRLGVHLLVDQLDDAVFVDVEGPTFGNIAPLMDDAVGFCRLFAWIAENGVIELQRLGECLVLLDFITTGREVGDVELANLFSAVTQRIALGRSATGEGLREPGDHHRLFAGELLQ